MANTTLGVAAVTEETRRQAVAGLHLLDKPQEERFERILRLARQMFGVQTALVTLLDDERQYHVAELGFGRRELPRSQSFCHHAVEINERLVVQDARLDERFRDNPLVTGPDHVRFYAGQPLASAAGVPVGALCIIGDRPRELTTAEGEMLTELAALVQEELVRSREYDRAREVQARLLPRTTPELPGYDVAGACDPAGMVGGDFFDWYRLGDELQFVVADVMGKGVGAAIIGAGVRAVMRGTSRYNDLETSVERLAKSIEADLAETGAFVTLFAGRLHPERHELTYIDAGHGIAGVVRANGEAQMVVSDGLPLGVWSSGPWNVRSVRLEPGDTFVCLSDGLLDLFDSLEEAREAIRLTVVESRDPHEVVDIAVQYGRDHHATDDLTIVALRRTA